MGIEAVFAGIAGCGSCASQGIGDAAVKALDHAVGLRAEGAGEPMADAVAQAEAVDGMAAGRFVGGLALHVDGEAVGELAAVVGEECVDRIGEVDEEAIEEGSGGGAVAAAMDLKIDVAGGAVDGDEGVALLPAQCREVLHIDMDEPTVVVWKVPATAAGGTVFCRRPS